MVHVASNIVLRWVLAGFLTLVPSVCRCHLGLHQHDEQPSAVYGPAHAHGHHTEPHDAQSCRHGPGEHRGPHDHDGAGQRCEDNAVVLSWLLCEHGPHECNCPPLRSIVQKVDDLHGNMSVAMLAPAPLGAHDDSSWPMMQARCTSGEGIPRPPTALLRLHCALIV